MKRVMLFLIFLLYISCKENYENFDNFSDLIQGDWLKLHPIRTVGDSVVIPSPMNIEIGFGFSHNGIMEHKTGFFKMSLYE
ncbi:hypothetical protein GR160_03275 [Flavobacterium sp. Sd200]|uniref:hypothetical protein n=1 Tax=Flavobacterium sp. Sd200 TaxID=2692211 RepID=UPI0013686C22|nr:hypothetical protein [Flavobacterium sp. Sd200]MXN90237.1 hypothetical protein [Flavobacterium sp. Sd200]